MGEAGEVRVVTRVAMPVVHWITFRFENLIFLSNINDKIGVFLSFIDDVFAISLLAATSLNAHLPFHGA